MSSIKTAWNGILANAKNLGVPLRARGILREYLQVKALEYIYGQKIADKLSFIGGTSLRLLRNLPRFSEDLDFDNLGVSDLEMVNIMHITRDRFESENIPVELFEKITDGKTYFEIRFPSLLSELGISTNPREKLMIKVDYSRQWRGQKTEVILLNRFGVVQHVIANTLDQILVEKLGAYVGRKTVQPRDMYDVVWLVAQGARLDREFMEKNGIGRLIEKALARFEKDGVTREMKQKLAPFLFVEGDENKLDLFYEIIKNVKSVK